MEGIMNIIIIVIIGAVFFGGAGLLAFLFGNTNDKDDKHKID
jgi:cbb3-type cytochrome oxidase maturation protein